MDRSLFVRVNVSTIGLRPHSFVVDPYASALEEQQIGLRSAAIVSRSHTHETTTRTLLVCAHTLFQSY
jgi:hypothetical protein